MTKNFGTEAALPDERRRQIERVIRENADMIYRIAYQNLQSAADAEDVLQEVSLTLVTRDAPLFDEKRIKPWLVRVTVNQCRDLRRKPWRRRLEPLDDHLDLQAPEHREVMAELWQLPQIDRTILYLYYYEAYTIAEIGEMLGKSPNTVSARLQRARKKLKKILTEGGTENA